MAFFAQFVLPVKTFRDRQKIFDRLVSYISGGHGPAIFVENGEKRERVGESEMKGLGVLWLDSASAAVTRTPVAIKQVLGPGVHFIDGNEEIAGIVDLHIQELKIGPRELEKPFDEKKEDQNSEEYRHIQDRRRQVSALTRDGIEVIPNITIKFRVDTGFPKEGQPGSRFGFRTGLTSKTKQDENEDKDAVRKAIMGQGINPNTEPDSPRHHVKWNELPGALVVDIWREYVAKFTLDDLITLSQSVPPSPPRLLQPIEDEVDPLSEPIQIDPNRRTMHSGLASILREINKLMKRAIDFLEGNKNKKTTSQSATVPSPPNMNGESTKKTALQVINEIILERLTTPRVVVLNEIGQRGEGFINSDEYAILKARGLKVLEVSISNLRFNPTLENQLIKQWSANWLTIAKAESNQIDRRRNLIETSTQEKALVKYAEIISREINELAGKNKLEVNGTLKSLLLRSRALIRSGRYSEYLRRRMVAELEEIEEMIKWVEEYGL